MKVVCVLRRSQEYDTDYVHHLFDGLSKQLKQFEFLVISGSEHSGWWSKMEIFRPDIKGDFLYFDLDTVIVGPIDELFTGKLTMLSDFNRLSYMASGVMFLPDADRTQVWEEWIKDPHGHVQRHRGWGDGGFLSQFYKKAQRFDEIAPGKIVSYKIHCRDGVPPGASVVCFHGRPRPREVGWKF